MNEHRNADAKPSEADPDRAGARRGTHRARRGLIAALAVSAALGLAACGGEDEPTSSTTTTTETGATGVTGPTGATGSDSTSGDAPSTASAGLGAAIAGLEDAGFEIREQKGQDLVTEYGLPQPITADEGVVATPSGQPGDVLVQSFADPADAADVEKAQDMGFTEAELVDGTIVVVGTDDSADLIADAVAAVKG